jgi:hypothetical protein
MSRRAPSNKKNRLMLNFPTQKLAILSIYCSSHWNDKLHGWAQQILREKQLFTWVLPCKKEKKGSKNH